MEVLTEEELYECIGEKVIAMARLRVDLVAANARIAELERSVLMSDAGRDSAFDLIVEAHNERDAAFNALDAANARIAEAEAKYQIARQQRNAANARADVAERKLASLEKNK
jgi:hypothetical protein